MCVFLFFAIMNKAAVTFTCRLFVLALVFIYLGQMSRSAMVVLYANGRFLKSFMFFRVTIRIYIAICNVRMIKLLCFRSAFGTANIFYFAILIGLYQYLIGELISISLMAKYVKHLFIYLVGICISPSVKYLLMYF